ncbi:MAG: tRNA (adenosine(37)-N6)-dimethylallyltransferase MiaA [Verrucomicrobiota bacterium]|nr:tRNA (adenosine(37)-N6)-dimethylallyltransferase MiaA [Verrucomicrobiota bacterium]
MIPIFLAGPTAAGKSALALQLAALLNGEIISVDSMQVYQGLDIGTAKPSLAERAEIPHHLIDILPLDESFDAAAFVHLAHAAEQQIRSRGRRPIYCGGTGFYFKAFLFGLGSTPPGDPLLRQELERAPLQILLAELQQADPLTFSQIDRSNRRRVVRAVEVLRLTGKPFSAQKADWKQPPLPGPLFCLRREKGDLDTRIDVRVDRMFASGLVDETKSLLTQGLRENQVASQALGYKQVIAHLNGELSLQATMDLVKLRTRQFAKRQNTWFRHQLPCTWLHAAEPPKHLAERVIELAQNFRPATM